MNNSEEKSLANGYSVKVVKTETTHQNGNGLKNGHLMGAKEKNGLKNGDDHVPPDGGMRGWTIMISAFVCNGVIFGLINTCGIINNWLVDDLRSKGDPEAASKASLVGSLTLGTTFLLSSVSGCLTDKIGLRLTTLIGGLFCTTGLLLSSFFVNDVNVLYFTYSILFGIGASLSYTPTIAILGHYFKRYLGKVSGFVASGSSIFTIILPKFMEYIIEQYGIEINLRVMAAISGFIVLCSLVYKPLFLPPEPAKPKASRSRAHNLLRSVVNVEIFKIRKYVLWSIFVSLALFGYFVPYVHMQSFIAENFKGEDLNWPVMSIAITSGFGRLIFGTIADLPSVNPIVLQQCSLIFIGVFTALLPITSSYYIVIFFSLLMGIFDGCFITMFGPIVYKLCGPNGAAQGLGFVFALSSIPITFGPKIAGIMYDSTQSFTLPFILSGIPPLIGATLLISLWFIPDQVLSRKNSIVENGITEVWHKNDETKIKAPLVNGHKVESEKNGVLEKKKKKLPETESLTDVQTNHSSVEN